MSSFICEKEINRHCTKCKKYLNLAFFSRKSNGKYQRDSICKSCKIELLKKHEKKCLQCHKKFMGEKKSIFCSNFCKFKYIPNDKKRNLKMSISKIGDKNPNWVGSKVGYSGIHSWVKRRLKKPLKCENCKKCGFIDLANKSGKYLRDLADWIWLCRSCHMKSDGRIKNLRCGKEIIDTEDGYITECEHYPLEERK